MITKRNFGTVAALGGFTAMAALLTGLPSARADELGDLKANQELLQRRTDQLAQATFGGPNPSGYTPGYGGAQAPVGTLATAAPGAPVGGGSFPRSFLIPGTDTSIRVGGQVQADIITYFSGLAPAPGTSSGGENQTSFNDPGATGNDTSIPLKGSLQKSRSGGVALSTRESKFNVETRTPTAWGEARTFIEIDFQQPNNQTGGPVSPNQVSSSFEPRLRYAYASLGGLLVGQANSNFEDTDSQPEVLNFGGPTGYDGPARHPQVRYTIPVPWALGGAFSVAAEQPTSDLVTPFGYVEGDTAVDGFSACSGTTATSASGGTAVCVPLSQINNPAYQKVPDFTFAYQLPQSWGHFNAHGLVREISINDGRFVNRDFIGYGGGFGLDVKPNFFGMFPKDDITMEGTLGSGSGYYIADSAGGLATNFTTAPTTAAAAALVRAKPINAFGGHFGYQHWWTNNLRSTADFAVVHSDVSSQLIAPVAGFGGTAGSTNKEIDMGVVNLIWSPVAFVDVGVEYVYAHRVVVSNVRGDANSLEGTMRIKF